MSCCCDLNDFGAGLVLMWMNLSSGLKLSWFPLLLGCFRRRWWSGGGGGPEAANFSWTIVAGGGGGGGGLGKMRWRWVDYRNSTKSWGWIRNREFSWILCFSSKFWFIKMLTPKEKSVKIGWKKWRPGENWKLKKFGGILKIKKVWGAKWK